MSTVGKRTWTYKGELKTAWVVRFNDLNGKRRIKTFDKKKDAERYKLEVDTGTDIGKLVADADSMLIKKLSKQYLEHIDALLDAGSITRGYRKIVETSLRLSIIPCLGEVRMSHLTVTHVVEFTKFMLTKQHLAHATASQRRAVLARMEGWARRRGFTGKQSTTDAMAEYPLKKGDPIRIPTKDDMTAILDAANVRGAERQHRTYLFTKIMINLAAFCGLRLGEILALTPAGVDFERRLIKVRHSLDGWGDVKGPKTESGNRDVPCPAHLIDMLEDWTTNHFLENRQSLLFTSRAGIPLAKANVHRDSWYPVLKRAGLWVQGGDNLHIHALRHFAGSWWIENGLPIPVVARLLGHSKPDTTMRVYAHALKSMAERQDALDGFAAALLRHGRNMSPTNDAKSLILKAS